VTDAVVSDRQIVDAVLAGDRESFRVFVERESVSVIATCARILRDPVEAQDAAQDTFVQAFQALATYRGDGAFAAWLRRIAVRVAIARLAARHAVVALDDQSAERIDVSLSTAMDPEAQALGDEYREVIVDAIGKLPAAQRDVVILRFYGDLTLDEIAHVTSHPVGTVKSRLSRGIARLRAELEPGSVS